VTRLLVTDLDATIVFDRSVSPADREAMARWRAAGNLLAVDTGKSSFATRDVLEPLGVVFDYGIVFTGAVLVDSSYQVLSARYLPDGVARDVATRTVDLPGVTTYATTIETDYILADNNEEISSILAVFEHLSLEEMDAHRFIGVPLRVTDDAPRERHFQGHGPAFPHSGRRLSGHCLILGAGGRDVVRGDGARGAGTRSAARPRFDWVYPYSYSAMGLN